LGDEDCPEETTCGADHECHKAYPCDSDKDCKEMEMVCDKDAGLCVACLGPEECQPDEYCLGGYCVADDCSADESKCEEGSVLACADDGSAWQVDAVCGAGQYCEEGACKDAVCPAGEGYCEAGIAKVCDDIGSAVLSEDDCEGQGLNCYNGECTESVCPPGEPFCDDDSTIAQCADDGMSFSTAPCAAKQFCEAGACLDEVCEPSTTYCEGNKVTVCNSKGSAIQSTADCGALVCVAGGCQELVCSPEASYCDGKILMQCNATGTSTETVKTCGPDQYCGEDGDTAACQDQVCSPGNLSCDGTIIVECDELGASEVPGTNCADQDKGCVDGECVEAYCGDGIKQDGEECDDGNDAEGDGCSGQCKIDACVGLHFDGASILNCDGSVALELTKELTVELLMRPSTLAKKQFLFRYSGNGDQESVNALYSMHLVSGGGIGLLHEKGAGGNVWVYSATTALKEGTWQALTIVREVTPPVWSVYLDGIYVEEIEYGVLPSGGEDGWLEIGGETDSSGYNFTGDLAYVRIWNTALDKNEVMAAAGDLSIEVQPSLVGFWAMDAGTGGVVEDLAAGGNDLEIVGASWFSEPGQCVP